MSRGKKKTVGKARTTPMAVNGDSNSVVLGEVSKDTNLLREI